MTIQFHPFENPRNTPVSDPNMSVYRVLIPLTREQLFTLEDISLLQSLGLDPMWVMEYVLFLWFGFSATPGHPYNFDDVYEIVCDDVATYLLKWDNSARDVQLQQMLSHTADQFIGMLRRMHGLIQQYIKDLPDQVPPEDFESLTLECEDVPGQFMVIALNVNNFPCEPSRV